MPLACGRNHHHTPWGVRVDTGAVLRLAVELRQDVPENRRARGGDVTALADAEAPERAVALGQAPCGGEAAVRVGRHESFPLRSFAPTILTVPPQLENSF